MGEGQGGAVMLAFVFLRIHFAVHRMIKVSIVSVSPGYGIVRVNGAGLRAIALGHSGCALLCESSVPLRRLHGGDVAGCWLACLLPFRYSHSTHTVADPT